MGERKGVNKYYPPDWDPKMGNLNKYHGTHALRERARKIHEGIIIVRFEMPYNIWCNGCGNHIGMGVRYNAQKRKVGNYYTTPVYKFRMKCHLCDQYFEIQTDPKNCDYVILSGAKRKEERWDPAVTENIQTTDRDVKEKLVQDAMFKLEHEILDKQKAVKVAPTLTRLEEIRDPWKDDYAVNQVLRQKFRTEKKDINDEKVKAETLKHKASLPSSLELVAEAKEDVKLAKKIRYGKNDLRPDVARKHKRRLIKLSSIFTSPADPKSALARKLSAATVQKVKFAPSGSGADVNDLVSAVKRTSGNSGNETGDANEVNITCSETAQDSMLSSPRTGDKDLFKETNDGRANGSAGQTNAVERTTVGLSVGPVTEVADTTLGNQCSSTHAHEPTSFACIMPTADQSLPGDSSDALTFLAAYIDSDSDDNSSENDAC